MEAILKREIIVNKTACRTFAVIVFIILTALGGFVRIPLPFTPVPITLQTFFVLLAGAFLGRNLGVLSQATYMLLAFVGFGPTNGYFIGFIAAAALVGSLVKYTKEHFFATLALFFLADIVLLLCGMLWLRLFLGQPLARSLIMGFVPFLAGDILKAAAAAFVYLRFSRRAKEIL
jgi:biotin transport system substrate-specific component